MSEDKIDRILGLCDKYDCCPLGLALMPPTIDMGDLGEGMLASVDAGWMRTPVARTAALALFGNPASDEAYKCVEIACAWDEHRREDSVRLALDAGILKRFE